MVVNVARKPNKRRQVDPRFKWTAEREEAALLLAHDELTDEAIATKCNIDRSTLWTWKNLPEFSARIDENLEIIRRRIRSRGISICENRIKALQDRWERMKKVIDARSEDLEMQTIPGGSTGLLVHNVKSIGAGLAAERVDLYEVDTALLKELREHERQAAQELGQWMERKDVTSGGLPVKAFLNIDTDAV